VQALSTLSYSNLEDGDRWGHYGPTRRWGHWTTLNFATDMCNSLAKLILRVSVPKPNFNL